MDLKQLFAVRPSRRSTMLFASLAIACPLFSVSAQAEQTFRLVSQASGKCIHLQAADQSDGGGVTLRDCKNFPDFFITANPSRTPLSFQLNSSRFVCIFATETPDVDPGGERAKVQTRNCGNLPNSLWIMRTSEDGIFQLEKLNGIDHTNFCMSENAATSAIELDVCQSVPEQEWKLERVIYPGEQ